MKFSTLEEVIRRANDTHYGLAAGILTNDLSRALTFSQAVNAGSVWYTFKKYCFKLPVLIWKLNTGLTASFM